MKDRKAYIEKLTAQLKVWDAEIQKLEAKADSAKVDAKSEYQQRIQKLRERREEAQSKVNKLQQSSEEAWDELKAGTEKVFADIKNTFNNTIAKFK